VTFNQAFPKKIGCYSDGLGSSLDSTNVPEQLSYSFCYILLRNSLVVKMRQTIIFYRINFSASWYWRI